ncbi:Methylated-DNA--protein-cysteine methyltransferase [hydrothermal vent metagenome]|uniref:methylated-DNA--[protein]-cysteine S-methyltransferase n=1 Tax=hydrothermal vent metagenome TaxID=652676 RepID=A0A3B1BW35_9ZZZZ
MDFDSPIGILAIQFTGACVSGLSFLDSMDVQSELESAQPELERFRTQLQNYFAAVPRGFNLPLQLKGTDFQQRVWAALQQIPMGEVRTYGQLAEQLHSSARAVGNACRHNPVPLIVPCHRVVSARGLGGFCGRTDGPEVRRKHWLLSHEGIEFAMPDVA